MTNPSPEGGPRVLVVGDDGEVGAVLHLHLLRAGWSPVCVPAPELVDPIATVVTPHAIVLALPETPSPAWGSALTSAATAAQAGVRVVLVAPSREVVEPLAAVSGAERAMSRTELLAAPMSVLGPPPPRGVPPPIPQKAGAPGVPPPIPAALTPVPRPGGGATTPALFREATTFTFGFPSPPPARTPPPVPNRTPARDVADLVREFVQAPDLTPTPTCVTADVSLVSEHNFFVGSTRKLDSGGVFVSMSHPPPLGAMLNVRLGLPDTRKVELRGEVVFVRARGAMGGRQPSGCGIKLTAVPAWAAEVAERFFVSRPPILYQP